MKTPMTFAPLAAGLLLAFNAAAQDHAQHGKPDTQEHAGRRAAAKQDHAQHHAKPKAASKPEAKPAAAASPMDHAAMGHEMPAREQSAVDHGAMGHDAGPPMDHAAIGHPMPRPADQPSTPIPVLTDEDRAAAVPPPGDHPVHDDSLQHYVLFNRLEGFDTDDGSGMEWEGQGWIGKDRDKLWVRSEGERTGGHTESADLEVLYGRAIARWWDVVAGVRHDFKPGASRDFVAIGVQGLAPYKFEVEATAYIGQSGQAGARLEVEYETLLSNRLILQPLVEVNAYAGNDARRGIGAGLGTAEAGLRLRYEITRQFAPYIGIVHERAFGRTADMRRADGDDANDTRIVAGFRIWF